MEVIANAEKYGWTSDSWTDGTGEGWAESYSHNQYLPVEDLYGRYSSLQGLITSSVFPKFSEYFNINEDRLKIGQFFPYSFYTAI